MVKTIVLYGAGGHAKAVADTVEKQGVYRIRGLLDDNRQPGSQCYGYEILGGLEWLRSHAEELDGIIVAIGDNWIRAVLSGKIGAIAPEIPFVKAIHPSAQLARGSVIGDGSVIMAGAAVGSDSTVGEHVIMYPLTSLDHDSNAGNFTSFAPKAVTGGGVTIGDYTAIAIGATLAHSVSIGEHCVIGAGATVLGDILPHIVAYGTPARPVRERLAGERYL
ncbi:NeuD/PglB/VioB family sugar acetyltransferase [Paenibacillus sp. CAU 1782]